MAIGKLQFVKTDDSRLLVAFTIDLRTSTDLRKLQYVAKIITI